MESRYGIKLKRQAQILRKKGLSYNEIAIKLKIAKSTAKLWTQHIHLGLEQKKRLYTKQILLLAKGPNSSHERRKTEIGNIIDKAELEIKSPLVFQTYKLMGVALYWAEGSKTQQFAITNSDPILVDFFVKWLRDIFGIQPYQLKVHLNIYPDQNEPQIKKFWSKMTGIPLENFGKSFIKPVSKGYKKNKLYYGTIRIRVVKGSNFRYQTLGWLISALKGMEIELKRDLWTKSRSVRP